jgi:hypothetical protein
VRLGTTPKDGQWKIRIHPTNGQPSGGKYHGWHGASRGLFIGQPRCEGESVEQHPSESAILAYLGEIPGSGTDRSSLDAHFDECPECQALVAAIARTNETTEAASRAGSRAGSCATPAVGDLLGGRFRLMSTLGAGSMGIVFRATDTVLGVPVAVKVFSRTGRLDSSTLDSIRREASIGRRLHHPHIRRVFDLETSDDVMFLTMELIEGETLEQRLRRGRIDEVEALRILDQICAALAAAHAAGIVHRDLKPGNVVIEEATGRVVVMDFGLARDLDALKSQNTKGLIGTPAYWSPEQSRGEPATPASDVFSLGLIAHYLLSGEPFSLSAPAPLPSRHRHAVRRCLAQLPKDRFPTVRAARDAFLQRSRVSRLHVVVGLSIAAVAFGLCGVSVSRPVEAVRPSVAVEPPATAVVAKASPAQAKDPDRGWAATPATPALASTIEESSPVTVTAARPTIPKARVASAPRTPDERLGVIDRESPYGANAH